MDIDCDGANSHGGNCGYDESIQDQTSFKDIVSSQYGIPDLDANIHPYVVFGNTDYDPQRDGMWPLSVMVVVCGDQLVSTIYPPPEEGVVFFPLEKGRKDVSC